MQRRPSGFTIVELLVVIVVIGILATITIVSYTGISNRAIISSLQSDLDNASKQLKLFQVENSGYPTSITDCSGATPAPGNLCIKKSGSNVIANYVKDNTITPQGFCINITNGTNSYKITSTTYNTPISGDCTTPVPVATTYSTPGSYTYTVPATITSVQLEAWGAQGGGASGGSGGLGGYSKGNLAVTSGSSLYVNVNVGGGAGGAGYYDSCFSYDAGGAGGGASDVRYGGTALSNRVIVGGGGGGASGSGYNCGGGSWHGDPGTSGGGNSGGGSCGGTQTSGYALGTGASNTSTYSGGGGGGGYYGGNIFGAGSYGCGGSGYIGGVTSGTMSTGTSSSAKVVITTIPPPIF